MNVKAKVIESGMFDGRMVAKLQLDGKLPKIGSWVTVSWGVQRTPSQNALYWVYLNWLIEHGGLKDQGHFSAEALHLDLKAHFLSEKIMEKGEFKAIEESSTTTLNKSEFTEYMEKVDMFVKEFFDVNTQPFWDEHKEKYQL